MCVGFYAPVIPRFQELSKEATMQHVQSAAHDSAPHTLGMKGSLLPQARTIPS